ncbi:MAG: NUDIX hydrolase [Candidatus Bathyarchaeota archaeon]|nr:MAG: NUDIX hydrolase [Candidatus Bathyarchaeota archaeon]
MLLTLRGNEPSKGTWGLPGGVVELGESVQGAVIREVEEETGIRVRPERLITVFDRVVKDGDGRIRFHYVLCEYLCATTGGALRASSDAKDAVWVPLNRLDSFVLSAGTRRFIENAVRDSEPL